MIQVGDIVETNDGTGPYYIAEIHCDEAEGEPLLYFRCGWAGSRADGHKYEENYYLNGYRPDGRHAFSDRRLTVIGQRAGVQLDLLAVAA